MQDIQWLFLGWFARFVLVAGGALYGVHYAARIWRARRAAKQGLIKAESRPMGFAVQRS